MKSKIIFPIIAIALLAFAFRSITFQTGQEPWRKNQLIEPAELAKIINNPSAKKPIVYSIGPGGNIKGSIEMGAAQEKENLDKLKSTLSKFNKDSEIVIFCGCCPFEHCPNIRPAFTLLNEMKFTSAKLLNLSHNLKVDWIDKGYPMNN
ncbi:MAG: rhodanese-like domain-containing protein [Bacteroidota bacterium]|nr:rhodanese-like domain-containing protein [Bacteroidota bacterium]MDP3147415.1 rhodanese-like domain-containing protein [Bacteroidota bacterium]